MDTKEMLEQIAAAVDAAEKAGQNWVDALPEWAGCNDALAEGDTEYICDLPDGRPVYWSIPAEPESIVLAGGGRVTYWTRLR